MNVRKAQLRLKKKRKKLSNYFFPLLGNAIDPSHQANNCSANDEIDICFSYHCLKCHCWFFSFFSLILTQKCWCISTPHYDRERYFSLLKWIQKKTNPEGSAHQLQRKAWSEVVVGGCPWQSVDFWADRQSWWEHLSCWWELAVTAKSGYSQGRKEKKIKEVRIQGSMPLLLETNTLQPQHGACHCWLVYYCKIMMTEMQGRGKPDKVQQ